MSVKKTAFLSALILLLFVFAANAQSRYLEKGIGGSCFQFDTLFDASGLSSFGLSAAYSIGGSMDIGFSLDRAAGSVEGFDSTEWSFDFLYNIIVIKQSDYIPVSLQLEGTYGFTNISSDYLTNQDYTLEGQGFSVGASVFREFNSKGLFSFLVGAKGQYKNYLFTTTDNSDSSSTTERNENFKWGGIAGISFKPVRWPVFTIQTEILYDQTAGGIFIEPSLLIISPSF